MDQPLNEHGLPKVSDDHRVSRKKNISQILIVLSAVLFIFIGSYDVLGLNFFTTQDSSMNKFIFDVSVLVFSAISLTVGLLLQGKRPTQSSREPEQNPALARPAQNSAPEKLAAQLSSALSLRSIGRFIVVGFVCLYAFVWIESMFNPASPLGYVFIFAIPVFFIGLVVMLIASGRVSRYRKEISKMADSEK